MALECLVVPVSPVIQVFFDVLAPRVLSILYQQTREVAYTIIVQVIMVLSYTNYLGLCKTFGSSEDH